MGNNAVQPLKHEGHTLSGTISFKPKTSPVCSGFRFTLIVMLLFHLILLFTVPCSHKENKYALHWPVFFLKYYNDYYRNTEDHYHVYLDLLKQILASHGRIHVALCHTYKAPTLSTRKQQGSVCCITQIVHITKHLYAV